MNLRIADDLSLPLAAVTEKLGFIGVSGSGKSYAASKLAELMWAAGAQFVVLDPVGIWYGLRLAKDGRGAGIPIPVFGGLHGDVPLEETGGRLVADLIVDRSISAVLDVSQFDSDAKKARFAADFAERFFFRKKSEPSAVHFFLEECQEFVPQNPMRGEERMLHCFHRLQKLGRNFGIGTSLVTQRPQETSKKALNQAQTLFVFRLTGSQEREAVERWTNDKGLKHDILQGLPAMQTGDCHVWSPAWLKLFKTTRFLPKHTFDASKTPEVGVRAVARELAPIDLERIRRDMVATIEKAKANDPAELRRQLAQSQAEVKRLAARPALSAPKAPAAARLAPPPAIKVRALSDGQVKRVEVTVCRLEKMSARLLEAIKAVGEAVSRSRTAATQAQQVNLTPGVKALSSSRIEDARDAAVARELLSQIRARPELVVRGEALERVLANGSLGPSHRRVLNTLAWLAQLGVEPATRAQTAVLSGMTPGGGYYLRIVGELKTAGFVTYPIAGALYLTTEGRAHSDPGRAHNTNAAVQADVLGRLGPSHRRILEAILGAFPEPLTRGAIGEACRMEAAGGYFLRLVGELKTMGLITYPEKGSVRAADVLFVNETAVR